MLNRIFGNLAEKVMLKQQLDFGFPGFPLLRIKYLKHHFYIYGFFFKKPFRILRISERLVNDRYLCRQNDLLLSAWSGYSADDRPGILFIANNLQAVGGVETRLKYFIKQLSRSGFRVFIITEAECNLCFSDSEESRLAELKFNASNFSVSLEKIIRQLHINIVEFQFKTAEYLKYLDLDALKRAAVCGCTIHFKGRLPLKKIRQLDYRIFISERLRLWYPVLPDGKIFCNGTVKMPEYWQFKEQKKALYIARLGRKQMPVMRQFIEFCQNNSLDFDIAGDGKDEKFLKKMKVQISRKYGFDPARFIGKINTVEFLQHHAANYLFAAGVGQVIIECAMCGMPVLVLSEAGLSDATFVTPENYRFFRKRNFTINRQPEIPRSTTLERIPEYASLRNEILKDRDIANITANYIEFIRKYGK
ncbi:MAG: glycosyltransferase family 4 protein [Lentisphaerae bacterium]|nr:glycosyltransferase family 4 protein [Lentisphaerota bacterium]